MLTGTFAPFWTIVHCVFKGPNGPRSGERLIFRTGPSATLKLSSPIQVADLATGEVITCSGSRYQLSAHPHVFEEKELSLAFKRLAAAGCVTAELVPPRLANRLH